MAYAVIQIGGPVYGVGETRDEAIADAMQWLDRRTQPDDILEYGQAQMNDIAFVECTQDFLRWVMTFGGDIAYDVDDTGVAVLIEPDA